jgi:hypothetical protein
MARDEAAEIGPSALSRRGGACSRTSMVAFALWLFFGSALPVMAGVPRPGGRDSRPERVPASVGASSVESAGHLSIGSNVETSGQRNGAGSGVHPGVGGDAADGQTSGGRAAAASGAASETSAGDSGHADASPPVGASGFPTAGEPSPGAGRRSPRAEGAGFPDSGEGRPRRGTPGATAGASSSPEADATERLDGAAAATTGGHAGGTRGLAATTAGVPGAGAAAVSPPADEPPTGPGTHPQARYRRPASGTSAPVAARPYLFFVLLGAALVWWLYANYRFERAAPPGAQTRRR